MHITEKGQVTIPLHIREKYGFLPHREIEFIEKGNTVFIKLTKTIGKRVSRGRSLVEHLRGKATVKMSTEEIMRLTRGDK
jgi:bifunctional DNA-binding transcriptional regulator/antitoxin component of YhaV-PrlF toxin-antitoxin module